MQIPKIEAQEEDRKTAGGDSHKEDDPAEPCAAGGKHERRDQQDQIEHAEAEKVEKVASLAAKQRLYRAGAGLVSIVPQAVDDRGVGHGAESRENEDENRTDSLFFSCRTQVVSTPFISRLGQ